MKKNKCSRNYFMLELAINGLMMRVFALLLISLFTLPTCLLASDLPIALPIREQGTGLSSVTLPQESRTDTQINEFGTEPFQETRQTDLPIDINAIGRGEQPNIILSLRFFDLNLFSANSRRINEAIAEQLRLNREALESGLFESFEAVRLMYEAEQIAYTAASLNLFAKPASFGSIGQVEVNDEISIWITVSVLAVCAVFGYIAARAVVSKKEGR